MNLTKDETIDYIDKYFEEKCKSIEDVHEVECKMLAVKILKLCIGENTGSVLNALTHLMSAILNDGDNLQSKIRNLTLTINHFKEMRMKIIKDI